MTAPASEARPTESKIEALRQSKEFYEQLGDWALEAARAETLTSPARDRHLSSVPIERRRDTQLIPDERITKEGRPKSKDKSGKPDPRYWGFQYHNDGKFLGQIEGVTTGDYTIDRQDPDPRIGKVKLVMPSGTSPKLAGIVGGFSEGRKKAVDDLEHLPVEDIMKVGRGTGGDALPHKMRAFVEPGLAEDQTAIQETTLGVARKLHRAQEDLQRALEDRYKVAKADQARGHKVGKEGPVVKGLRKALKEAQKEFDKATKKPLKKVNGRIERANNQAIRKQNWYIKRELYGGVVKERADKQKKVNVQRASREIVQVYKDGKRVNNKTLDTELPQRKHE